MSDDNLNLRALFHQAADDVRSFVGSDATGNAQDDMFVLQHRLQSECHYIRRNFAVNIVMFA